MNKQIIAASTVTALLLSGTAFGQQDDPVIDENGATAPGQEMQDENGLDSPDTGASDTGIDDPATDAPTDPALEETVQDPADVGEDAPGAQPGEVESFLTGQAEGQFMTSNIMNVDVVGGADEQIGTVDDIIIDADGQVVGVVVGVGGFLGMGERDVAIPIDALEIIPVGDPEAEAATGTGWGWWGNDEIEFIRVNATQEELEAAPEFTRTDDTW